MNSVIFLIDSAPYGTEKAYGALHASIVCLQHGSAIGLYGDGAYLALSNQDSKTLNGPNLSHFIYAYPEVRIIADKKSLEERSLMDKELIELVDILDRDRFFNEIFNFDCTLLL